MLTGVSTTWLILAIVFTVLSGIVWIVTKISKRNETYEKAKQDLESAIDKRDWNLVDDARRRMHQAK